MVQLREDSSFPRATSMRETVIKVSSINYEASQDLAVGAHPYTLLGLLGDHALLLSKGKPSPRHFLRTLTCLLCQPIGEPRPTPT